MTDHYNLYTFSTKALLSRHQACWAPELVQYNFKIMFRPGTQNGKADTLTRRSGDHLEDGDGQARPTQPLIPPEKFLNLQLLVLSVKHDQDIWEALTTDTLAQEVFQFLKDGTKRHPVVSLGECTISDNLLLINKLVYIPNKPELHLRILKSCYNHSAAGHPSCAATYELVCRNYWWLKMYQTVAQFIWNCNTCTCIKPACHAPYGLLKTLEVPVWQWSSVSLDLITGLPMSNGFNALLIVVDRLSKVPYYIKTTADVNSKQVAQLFFDNIFRLHSIADSVVSDWGTQFISEFTRVVAELVGIQQKISTSFHPQTDGQIEWINAIME